MKIENNKDFWNSLLSNEKEEILEAIEEIDNNEVIDYDGFRRKYKKQAENQSSQQYNS